MQLIQIRIDIIEERHKGIPYWGDMVVHFYSQFNWI